MRINLIRPLFVGLVFLCSTTQLAAKPEAVNNGNYTTQDKEFYLSTEEIYFIRPGLDVTILEVTIPADRQLEVTYSLQDPAGLALDIDGIVTPGPVDMRYMLTHIPQGEEQKVKDTEGSRDEDGTLVSLGDGVYTYKFGTILPETYDMDATHTLVLVGRRDLREFDLDRYVDNQAHHFVPSGMYAPVPRDVVTIETCNGRCHDPLAMHGSRYTEIDTCTQCHNPGLIGRRDGLSKSFDVLIHRVHEELEEGYPPELNDCEVCHTGGTPTENFPLVANPNPALVCDMTGKGTTELSWGDLDKFEIRMNAADGPLFGRGNGPGSKETGKWVKDGTVFFLVDQASGETIQQLPVNATVLGCVSNAPGTFRGLAGTQHTNWLDHPSRRVCSSCHTDVNFETGEGHSKFEIIQTDDSVCHHCHKPDNGTEYGLTIRGAHKPVYKSAQLPGILATIVSVTNTNPGDMPTVTFSLGGKNGKLDPADMDFFRFSIVGPNEDFSFFAQESVTGAVRAGDNWTYTFATPLPADAVGSFSAGLEIFDMVPVEFFDGEEMVRHTAENEVFPFAIGDSVVMPRRMVVDDAKCENCHSNLALHGGIRHDPQYCVTCHIPSLVDIATPAESVHFKWMIHKIHRGADLENGYVVVRSRGTFDFSHVEFPGDLRNCENCHVNDSQQLSLPEGLLPTVIPNFWWDPVMPAAAACLSCHDSDATAVHAFTNTSVFGEACATCHGEGMEFAVDKVHAH